MFLGPDDALTALPRRIVVAGASGSGKTTLSARIADVLGIEHIEIDGLYHGENWIPRPSFEADVDQFVSGATWVTEWQYRLVRDRVADRSDLVVWIDPPRRTVTRQVMQRTVRRRLKRQVLWNGNIEPPLHRILVDPDHIIRFAWRTYPRSALRIARLIERRPELAIVRLHSRSDAERWVSGSLTAAYVNSRG